MALDQHRLARCSKLEGHLGNRESGDDDGFCQSFIVPY